MKEKHDFYKIATRIAWISADNLKCHFYYYGFVDLGGGLELHSVADNNTIFKVIYPDGNYDIIDKNYSESTRCNWEFVTEQVLDIICKYYHLPDYNYFTTLSDWFECVCEEYLTVRDKEE